MYGCEVWSLTDNSLQKLLMLLGITAFDESFRAVGERVPEHSQYLAYWISVD